jgi:hypothetical protein
MKPSEYILDCLKQLNNDPTPTEKGEVDELILKRLLSKKFRKYAAKPQLIEQSKKAIAINIAANKPINITFVHGSYKLWRLEDTPNAAWSELFAAMYYTNWLKSICDVYKPGVWFDFFVDDLIVPKLDNIPLADVKSYRASFQKVLDFLKPYQPQNFRMSITSVGDQFESEEAFAKKLDEDIKQYAATFPNGLPEVSEAQKATMDLNVKPTDAQKDPLWHEKNVLMHDAYIKLTKAGTGYHNRPDKILAFTQPLPSGMFIAVGTTKTSIAKFWVGTGALKPKEGSFMPYILSPKQLASTTYTEETIAIPGLDDKNFKKIKIMIKSL